MAVLEAAPYRQYPNQYHTSGYYPSAYYGSASGAGYETDDYYGYSPYYSSGARYPGYYSNYGGSKSPYSGYHSGYQSSYPSIFPNRFNWPNWSSLRFGPQVVKNFKINL